MLKYSVLYLVPALCSKKTRTTRNGYQYFSQWTNTFHNRSLVWNMRIAHSLYYNRIGYPSGLPCDFCGKELSAIWGPSFTHYFWDKTGLDPNAEKSLCHRCDIYNTEYWKERWAEYNNGRL